MFLSITLYMTSDVTNIRVLKVLCREIEINLYSQVPQGFYSGKMKKISLGLEMLKFR